MNIKIESENRAEEFNELVNIYSRLQLIDHVSDYMQVKTPDEASVMMHKLTMSYMSLLTEAEKFTELQLKILRVMKLEETVERVFWENVVKEFESYPISKKSAEYTKLIYLKTRLIFFQSHMPIFVKLMRRHVNLVAPSSPPLRAHLADDVSHNHSFTFEKIVSTDSVLSTTGNVLSVLGDLAEIVSVFSKVEYNNADIKLISTDGLRINLSISSTFEEQYLHSFKELVATTKAVSDNPELGSNAQQSTSLHSQIENEKHFGTAKMEYLENLLKRLDAIIYSTRALNINYLE